jgi:hypothetical protein
MIKRLGRLYSVLAIFTILSITFFAIGGCNDSNGDSDTRGPDEMTSCENIQGSSSGDIRTAGDVGCTTQIEDGCFFGTVSGSLSGDVETIFETEEEFNVITTKFFESTGITLVTDSDGDSLSGHIVAVADKDGNVASGLIQWFSDGSFGKYNGASGYVVLDIKSDFENKTYTATWSGVLCTN